MRYLAEVEGKQRADALVAYLITLSIATHVEAARSGSQRWEVWIRDEDQLPQARAELEAFQANPSDPKYAESLVTAQQIIQQKKAAAQAVAKNIKKVTPGRPTNHPLGSGPLPPLTLTLLISCIAISLLSEFATPGPGSRLAEQIVDKLSFVSKAAYINGDQDPAASLKQGELWRMITPIFLHGNPFHLVMNVLALVAFGRLTERLVGTTKFAVMILALGALPMMLACMMPRNLDGSPFTIGISGVVYGLVAYLWFVSSQRPELGFRIPDGLVGFLLLVVILGFAGIIQGVSNWGHLGGFVVGLALGLISVGKRSQP